MGGQVNSPALAHKRGNASAMHSERLARTPRPRAKSVDPEMERRAVERIGLPSEMSMRDLTNSAKPAPSPRELGVVQRNPHTPHAHALQSVLSYPVLPLNLAGTKRPRVFVRRPNGRRYVARYGTDMFLSARLRFDQPLLVVRQEANSRDVIISAIQSLDWLEAFAEGGSDDLLQIVPAGSFSYRKTFLGAGVRLLMRLHSDFNPVRMCGRTYPEVRLAAVVIPEVMFKGKKHLIITQRAKKRKGTYNSMWVFPGGHVEAGESLMDGAEREFSEETGLKVDTNSLKLRCCWQEVLPPKQLQFLMLVYSGNVVSPGETGEFAWSDLQLQKEEVARLALIPEELWAAVGKRADLEGVELDAVAVDAETGELRETKVPANEVTGYNLGFGHGIGSGHRYALLQYLDPFDKNLVLQSSRRSNDTWSSAGSRKSKVRSPSWRASMGQLVSGGVRPRSSHSSTSARSSTASGRGSMQLAPLRAVVEEDEEDEEDAVEEVADVAKLKI